MGMKLVPVYPGNNKQVNNAQNNQEKACKNKFRFMMKGHKNTHNQNTCY